MYPGLPPSAEPSWFADPMPAEELISGSRTDGFRSATSEAVELRSPSEAQASEPAAVGAPASPLRANRLLSALPAEELRKIAAEIEIRNVRVGQLLFTETDRNPMLFPLDAVISLVRPMGDGTLVEVGMVGSEGVAGVNLALGVEVNGHRAIVQGDGGVGILTAERASPLLRSGSALAETVRRFTFVFLAQVSQIAACNRRHRVDHRLGFWLLMLHDRSSSDEMSLTQDFLAMMLGTRRAGINEALQKLDEAGAIKHSRGRVQVSSRAALEQSACDCYAQLVSAYGVDAAANSRN